MNSSIGHLLTQSPIRPLQHHMALVTECVQHLIPLFEAHQSNDQPEAHRHRTEIVRLEEEADLVKRQIRAGLSSKWQIFLAFEKREILHLLNQQDKIADDAQDIARRLEIRPATIPAALNHQLLDFIRRNIDAVIQCKKIIDQFDELLETSFSGPRAEQVRQMITALSQAETETDIVGLELLKKLHAPGRIKVLDVVHWQGILELIGHLADHAENVGDGLNLLLAHKQ